MRFHSALIRFVAFAGLALATACQSTVNGQPPFTGYIDPISQPVLDGLSPVNAKYEVDKFFSENPDRNRIYLTVQGTRHDGFQIGRSGKLYFNGFENDRPLGDVTEITSMSGNRVCGARTDSWLAGCFEVFKYADGRLVVIYHLPSGGFMQYIVKDIRL